MKMDLDIEERSAQGSGVAKRLRRNGRIPGNVYGLDTPPFAVSVEPRRLDKVLRSKSGQNTILTLHLATRNVRREVLIRDLQRDPVTQVVSHVDFLRIDPSQPIEVSVPIHLVGTPVGVKLEGGLMDQINRDVTISCLPANIPDELQADVSDLHVGQHLSAGDLKLGEGVTLKDDPTMTLVVVESTKGGDDEAAGEAEGEEGGEAAAEASS